MISAALRRIRALLPLGRQAEPDHEPESIRRNTVFSAAVQLTGALLTGLLTLFLVRKLGPEDYGVFVLALGVGTVLLLPSDFGISNSTARFVAERRGDRGLVGRILGDALSLKLAASALVSVGLVATAVPIANAFDTDALVWPIRLIAVATFGQSLLALFTGFFEAMGRNSLGFRLVLSESSVEVGASVALVLAGTGAAGAAGGRAIGFCFSALVGIVLVTRLLGRGRVRVGPRPRWSFTRIAAYAGPLFIIDGAFALFAQIDVLLIGAILGTSAAGLFGAPMRLLAFVQYPGAILAGSIAPRLTRGSSGEPNVEAFTSGIRYLLLLQPLLAAPLLVWADPIVDIVLGADYAESAEVLRALTPFVLLFALGPFLATGVNYLGEARRRVPLAIAALAINVAIDLALLNEIGIVAGAIGTTVAMLVYVGGHLRILGNLVEIDFRSLGISLARSLLAFVATCAVLFAFGPDADLHPGLLVAGGACGLLAYVAVLVVTREVSRAEIDTALNLVRRRI